MQRRRGRRRAEKRDAPIIAECVRRRHGGLVSRGSPPHCGTGREPASIAALRAREGLTFPRCTSDLVE